MNIDHVSFQKIRSFFSEQLKTYSDLEAQYSREGDKEMSETFSVKKAAIELAVKHLDEKNRNNAFKISKGKKYEH